jgi:hypothetical protein
MQSPAVSDSMLGTDGSHLQLYVGIANRAMAVKLHLMVAVQKEILTQGRPDLKVGVVL